MKKVRTILYVVAVITGLFAAYLSFQVDMDWSRNDDGGAAISIDSGKDGGAAGFAILSGLALVAASITYSKKEE